MSTIRKLYRISKIQVQPRAQNLMQILKICVNILEINTYPLVAQLVEHPTLNRQVVGSNPTGRTKIRN